MARILYRDLYIYFIHLFLCLFLQKYFRFVDTLMVRERGRFSFCCNFKDMRMRNPSSAKARTCAVVFQA